MCPAYELKSRTFYKNNHVDMYEELHGKVYSELQNVIDGGVSFTADIWSNEQDLLMTDEAPNQ